MDYSNLFVCLMGLCTVFIGLICIIALVTVMSAVVRKRRRNLFLLLPLSSPHSPHLKSHRNWWLPSAPPLPRIWAVTSAQSASYP